MTNNFFTICSGFYILLLLIVFFSKKRLESIENKIYSWLIISNFLGIILAILSYLVVSSKEVFPVVCNIITKSYIIYLLVWIALFSAYVYVISLNSTKRTLKYTKKNL